MGPKVQRVRKVTLAQRENKAPKAYKDFKARLVREAYKGLKELLVQLGLRVRKGHRGLLLHRALMFQL